MNTPRTPSERFCIVLAALAIVAGALVAGRSAAAESPARPPLPASARPESLTATVMAAEPGAGTVILLTGVGHALRCRRVQIAHETRVLRGRATVPTTALTPGCIVRVECRETASGLLASRVELLQTPAPERKP